MSMFHMMLLMKQAGKKKSGESARHSTQAPLMPINNNQKNPAAKEGLSGGRSLLRGKP